jgi:hypothetical protein
MVHLKYRNDTIIGDLYFPTGFFFECYLDTIPERPTYPINEDAREDQEADQHIIFQRYEKRGNIKTYGVESLADALSLLPIMDEVYIDNTRVYDIVTDIVWLEEHDCLCEINISYLLYKLVKTL